MPTINYPFTTSGNYTFDSSKIIVSSGLASLNTVSQTGLTFSQLFSSDTGFTYDNSEIEFSSGFLNQIDITPANSIFAVTYDSDGNLNWHKSGGSLTGTLNGTPTFTGGRIVCASVQGIYYTASTSVVETHKFNYIPNYTTTPPSNINIYSNYNGTNNNDRLAVTHSPSGNNIRLTLNNSTGSVVISAATSLPGSFTPTSGQSYEFEIVVDSILGTLTVFIDGVLHGTNSPGAWTRGTASTRYYLGASPVIYNLAEASYDNYISFNNSQHTSGYTPGYTVDPNIYTISNVDLPVFTHSGVGNMVALDVIATTETGSPRYTIQVGTNGFMYWNGSSWAASDSTYAQAASLSDTNTNISTFPSVSSELTVIVRIHFTNTNTQGTLDDLTINYTGITTYNLDDPTIIPTTSFTQDALLSFIATTNVTGSDAVQYALRLSGQDKFWNGTAWVNSDGTYAQSNTISVIQANLGSFTERGVILPVIFLHSDDGTTTPNIDILTVGFDFYGGSSVIENICTVWGYVYNEINVPLPNIPIVITPNSVGVVNNKLIKIDSVQVITDSTGYWEVTLIETASAGDIWGYKFDVLGTTKTAFIPNLDSVEYNSLSLVP